LAGKKWSGDVPAPENVLAHRVHAHLATLIRSRIHD